MNKTMKTLTQYHFSVMLYFHKYLRAEISLDELIESLKEIQSHAKVTTGNYDNDKSLWFRFFPDDNLATTIRNIKNDLSLPSTSPNHSYMRKCMEMAINQASIQVYLS